MRKIFTIISAAMLMVFAMACGNADTKETGKDTTAVTVKFPEPTDSTANGLHPYYPTEQNILGQWYLPEPTDSTPRETESYIEFLADKSIKVTNNPGFKALKWELNGNVLIMSHQSGDPIEANRVVNDTLVLEAVSDTSLTYYNLHEPNFLMRLTKKK
ncbi:MAG TPA: hypothetical protein VK166_16480 [Chitinophagaceae bacterium]|nr:hypothetical protein [Chitinophagaceae bacterium]